MVLRFTFFLFLALIPPPAGASVDPRDSMNAAEIQQALKKLNVLGSALYIAAHPDDENTALLSYLASDRRVRTAYLSITRGDGGQNLIGTEKGAELGVIRTQELLAARKLDGAQQFFTRAIDFGYSKTPEETLRIWGKQGVLEDVVNVIRTFRPDIIITRFPSDGGGGHGHHTASALLAREAFDLAADPEFPSQASPWQAKRLLWNTWRPDRNHRDGKPPLLEVNVGKYNPLLGKSYTEIAGASRSMHKSQGFGAAQRRGMRMDSLEQIAGDPAKEDLFDGVDLTWSRMKDGSNLSSKIQAAISNFDPESPEKTISALLDIKREMRSASNRLNDGNLPPLDFWVQQKEPEVDRLIAACAGLTVEALAGQPTVIPGEEIEVRLTALIRANFPMQLRALPGVESWQPRALKENQPETHTFPFRVKRSTEFSQPHWLQGMPTLGSFSARSSFSIIQPEGPAPFLFPAIFRIQDLDLKFEIPLQHRWTDPVRGELYRKVVAVPPVSVRFPGSVILFPYANTREVYVDVKALHGPVQGEVKLEYPDTWYSENPTATFHLGKKGAEKRLIFRVTPPAEPGSALLGATALVDGQSWKHGLRAIDYPHIPIQTLFPESQARMVRFDLALPDRKIGYIMGSGDEIPQNLIQAGFRIEIIPEDKIHPGTFQNYDVLISGIRAFNTIERLNALNSTLMRWVERGGTFIAQYNTVSRWRPQKLDIGPAPFQISRDRVTVEEAAVKFELPDHPLLNTPNKITGNDFDGWVQERGLYFANEWGEQFEAPLSSHDPGEPPRKGGLLYVQHGEGVFIYTGLSFFRQLPAGVPGAYRLFANLIAGGKP